MVPREWFTVQECIGLPGYPGTAPAVRGRLNALSKGKEGIKRKRVKSKAWEYHISILPAYVRDYMVEKDDVGIPGNSTLWEAEPKEIWDMMFRLLTLEQRKQVSGLFGTKGIDTVFPFLFDEKPPF